MDSQSPEEWVDRFGDEPRKGADIVVQCLEREGAHRVFAYPGGCSMEIHQALTRSNLVKNTLCRHEQVSTTSWFRACIKLFRQGGCCLPVAHAFSSGPESPCASTKLPRGQGAQTDRQMQSGKASRNCILTAASYLLAHIIFADSICQYQ